MTRRDAAEAARGRLVAHVLDVQARIRSCAGCGECCTARFNSVRILPVEARRIAEHLATLSPAQGRELLGRIRRAIARSGLRRGGPVRRYRCPFLEEDRTCAVPLDVKPVACLAFNPVHVERCEMETMRFFAAHDPVEAANARLGLPPERLPIPLAVHEILSGTEVLVGPGVDAMAAEGGHAPAAGHGARRWIALHKPCGVMTTTSDPDGRPTVMDLVPKDIPGLSPVGRLDRASEGLLLLTNDHRLASRLLSPRRRVPRAYRVKLDRPPSPGDVARLGAGLRVEGERFAPAGVASGTVDADGVWVDVVLTEGRNREIRRMMASLSLRVLALVRTGFGPVTLGDLPPGAWRDLDAPEVAALRDAAGGFVAMGGPEGAVEPAPPGRGGKE